MPAPHKKSLAVTLTVLSLAALSLVAVAWFAGYKKIGNMGFLTSSNTSLPKLDMWMYHSKNDFTSPENETEGWVSQQVSEDADKFEYYLIPSAKPVENADKTIASYEFASLHFGKVDNLVALKNDNKILLRFYFDASMLNDSEGHVQYVAFTLAYNTEGYEYNAPANQCVLDSIYLLKEVTVNGTPGVNKVDLRVPANQDKIDAATGGATVPDPIYVLECRKDEPRAMQFLQIRYAVSTAKLSPKGDGWDGAGLTFSDPVPINCGSAGAMKDVTEDVTDEMGTTSQVTTQVPVCQACANHTCGKAELTADDLEGVLIKDPNNDKYLIGEDGFYVYIELAPLLDAYGMQENILDYFVPAYMFFDVKLDVEIG